MLLSILAADATDVAPFFFTYSIDTGAPHTFMSKSQYMMVCLVGYEVYTLG